MLGPWHLSYEVERQPGEQEVRFHVEGLAFPDADFPGVVSLSVSLLDARVRATLAGAWGTRLEVAGLGRPGLPGGH